MSQDDDARVLANFLDEEGRLRTIPARQGKKLIVLRHLVAQFTPGERYPESAVNDVLGRFHPDVAALRRYLIETGMMARAGGVYWRTDA